MQPIKKPLIKQQIIKPPETQWRQSKSAVVAGIHGVGGPSHAGAATPVENIAAIAAMMGNQSTPSGRISQSQDMRGRPLPRLSDASPLPNMPIPNAASEANKMIQNYIRKNGSVIQG